MNILEVMVQDFNNGLTYNTVFGTRVEDDEICLNVPDGVRVHAVFESSTKNLLQLSEHDSYQ